MFFFSAKCGTLTNLTGGTINLITNGTVTSASASCSEGHTMKGVARLSCQADGSWDINLPECGKLLRFSFYKAKE